MSLLYKADILEACQEICMEQGPAADGSLSIPPWLDASYADVLRNKDQILIEIKSRADSLSMNFTYRFYFC